MSNFEILILKRVLILSGSLGVQGKEEKWNEFQKGTFLKQPAVRTPQGKEDHLSRFFFLTNNRVSVIRQVILF
jgi:hypothetical protein